MLLWAGMPRFWWHRALCLAQGALLDAIMMTRLSLIKADVDELQVISHCYSLGYYQGVYEDKSYHSLLDNAVMFSLTHGPQVAHLPLKRWPLAISKGLGPRKPHPNGKAKPVIAISGLWNVHESLQGLQWHNSNCSKELGRNSFNLDIQLSWTIYRPSLKYLPSILRGLPHLL